MRTSLNEIAEIENLLLKFGDPSDRLVTEAKVLSNPSFKDKTLCQSVAYELIQQYGRNKLLDEIKSVEERLFTTSKYRSFQKRIRAIFN